jgi:hypothetical protein
MRTWIKWTSAAAFGLLATSAIAADHGDPTEVTAFDGSDIADVYTWMADADTLTMIMTINTTELSDAAYYVFNIGRSADAATAATVAPTNSDTTKVICWYDVGDQTTCVVDDGTGLEPVTYVQGLAATELLDTEGTLRVHVGQHADPFFFYLTGGFLAARTEVLQLVEDGDIDGLNINGEGCPTDLGANHPDTAGNVTTSAALLGILDGSYDNTTDWNSSAPGTNAVDDLATNDVTGIVVELNTGLLAGSGDHFQVWAATHVRN